MYGVIGLGIDFVDVRRLRVTLLRTPDLGQRLFGPAELLGPPESLAGRFAAKEALAKALGGGHLPWRDVEVMQARSGAPGFALAGRVRARATELGVSRTHLSITHDGEFAAAVVVLEGPR